VIDEQPAQPAAIEAAPVTVAALNRQIAAASETAAVSEPDSDETSPVEDDAEQKVLQPEVVADDPF
jgi:hypothetical protein